MTSPARVDQEIWRGDNYPPLSWGFGPATAPEIPTGASFQLDVEWNATALALAIPAPLAGTITATSPDSLAVGEVITIVPTSALPAGLNISYAVVTATNTVQIGFTATLAISLTSQSWRVCAHR